VNRRQTASDLWHWCVKADRLVVLLARVCTDDPMACKHARPARLLVEGAISAVNEMARSEVGWWPNHRKVMRIGDSNARSDDELRAAAQQAGTPMTDDVARHRVRVACARYSWLLEKLVLDYGDGNRWMHCRDQYAFARNSVLAAERMSAATAILIHSADEFMPKAT
jgi:hypothetical protein